MVMKSYGFRVGSSGLIVAFAVAVWAAYFVPLVLRRYDEAGKSAALEQKSARSRVVTPQRDRERSREATAAPIATPKPMARQADPKPRVRGKAAKVAARRRRRTFLALLAITLVLMGLTAALITPWWAPGVGAGLVVAWLVACRLQVRSELGLSGSRREERQMTLTEYAGVEPAPELLDGSQDRLLVRIKDSTKAGLSRAVNVKSWLPGRREKVLRADYEDTIILNLDDIEPDRRHVMEDEPLESGSLEEQLQIAVPSVSRSGEALWDPLPVTLPTYVTKPRAGRTVRTIDFSQPGAWTSGHVEGEDTDFPSRQDERGDDGDRRHAVGH